MKYNLYNMNQNNPEENIRSLEIVSNDRNDGIYTYHYDYICLECGKRIKQIVSHTIINEQIVNEDCQNCQKVVEAEIRPIKVEVPRPLYSKNNPYTGNNKSNK